MWRRGLVCDTIGEVTFELELKTKGRRQRDSMCKVPVATLPIRGTEQKPVREGGGQGLESKDESGSSCGCGWRGLQ